MKRLIVPFSILLGAGIIFYLINKPANVSVAPTAASTSSAAQETRAAAQKPPEVQGPRVRIGQVDIPVEVIRTAAEMQKGLSGRLSLDQDKGMLFVFSRPDMYRFWMPDMHFPIDIIWISAAKKVVSVSANVSNDFDPANPKFYTPASPAQYVLEVNAGFAARTGIGTGDKAIFTEI